MLPTAAIADDLLTALSNRHQMQPLTGRIEGFDIAAAYRVSRAVTARRVAQGERVLGRKIGFTNRTIWDEYGVHQPIYGPIYDTTVRDIAAGAEHALGSYVEPRIEPEIVFGLVAAPEADMDEEELMSCLGWAAHGFEIVQSVFPGWRFQAADCIAAFGLHGGLLIGPRVPIGADDHALWLERLRHFSITLSCNGEVLDTGRAANVLDGPVSALRHLLEVLSLDPEARPLEAGDIITTGTLTRAFPVKAGEQWTTSLDGIELPGMAVRFV
jgi:2-oxo-3-hexenedioate decarboxylase